MSLTAAALTSLGLLVGGLALSACGSSATPTPTTTAASSASAASRSAARHRPAPAGPRVGAALRLRARGATLIVRIIAVIDPLHGGRVALTPGTRAIGVLASVRDLGPQGYDGSATSNFSLRSEAGEASPVFVPSGRCQTLVQDFMNAIGAGELRTGCVAFAIPKAAAPLAVRFAPDQGSAGGRSWLIVGRG